MNDDRKSAIAVVIIVGVLLSGSLFVLFNAHDQKLPSGMLPAFENYGQVEQFVGKAGQQGEVWNESPTSGALASGDARHSTTNIQVEGVDEADCVKTDGTYLFITSVDAVSIVRAYPPEAMENVSRVDLRAELGLDSGYYVWINGIYIFENRLVVLASISGPNYYSNGSIFAPMIWRVPDDKTMVCIFGLSSPQEPKLLGTFGISGYPITSRMADGILYSITQQYIWTFQSDLAKPKTFGPDGSAELPATSVHFDPESTDPSSFINVLAVDVVKMTSEPTSLLAGYASTIYMSQEALYLTFQKWTGGQASLVQSGGASSSTTNASEDSYRTTIFKLSIDGLSIHPAARGEVPGYLLNQFSMDERDGRLRVATSSGWTDQQSNSVFILDEHLNATGELRNIAPGERIYSARFVDDVLYLVTFRQVDPLFVIDLSDPAAPSILGQLKVPGFSSYLQPLDQGHLLGLGMQNGSLKLSLFDVTQPSSPQEVGTVIVPGWSNSQAMWDHKAILFDAQTGTLAIPITSYDQSWNYSSSIMVFDVNATHVGVRGVVPADQMEYVMRAQFIGDFLYSISDSTVRVNLMSDLSPVQEFVYQDREPNYFPCLMGMGEVVVVGAMR
jgi:inhibitor of cysteine peptidase